MPIERKSNVTPVPKQPSQSYRRPTPRYLIEQESTCSQTEPIIDNDPNKEVMKENYAKAVSFVNACHRRVNAKILKRHSNKKNKCKTRVYLLPEVPNYIIVLPYLMRSAEHQNGSDLKAGDHKTKCGPIPMGERKKVQTDDEVDKATELPQGDYNFIKQKLEDLIQMISLSPINIDPNAGLKVPPNPPHVSTTGSKGKDHKGRKNTRDVSKSTKSRRKTISTDSDSSEIISDADVE